METDALGIHLIGVSFVLYILIIGILGIGYCILARIVGIGIIVCGVCIIGVGQYRLIIVLVV